jgi:hypothetical protein
MIRLTHATKLTLNCTEIASRLFEIESDIRIDMYASNITGKVTRYPDYTHFCVPNWKSEEHRFLYG